MNLFQRNRAVESGLSLQYIAPQIVHGVIVVRLDKEEVNRETKKCAMIVYSVRECPGYNKTNKFVSQT